jgi:hypothetical protein
MNLSLRPTALLLLATTVFAVPAFAQEQDTGPAFLKVCNKGNRAVSIATAEWDMDLTSYNLGVSGWVRIAPGECGFPYDYEGASMMPGPAYLAFALFDNIGAFVPARVTSVPDIGGWSHSSVYAAFRFPEGKGPALTAANRQLCVRQAAFEYAIHTKEPIDCNSFRPGEGSWQSLIAQMYFHPSATHCFLEMDKCFGGAYFLDIAPKTGSSDLVATPGTPPDENGGSAGNPPPTPEEQRVESPYYPPTPPAGSGLSVSAYQPSWIGQSMTVRGTVSNFVVKDVAGEQWVYLYFKERPDSAVVACSRDANWLLGVLGIDDFQSAVGKFLEFNGDVVKGTCSEQGAGLWIWQRNQARLVAGGSH